MSEPAQSQRTKVIDLVTGFDELGREVWMSPDIDGSSLLDIVVRPGGEIELHDGGPTPTAVSTVTRGRMSTIDWNAIIGTAGEQEAGTTSAEIVVRPGGQLVLADPQTLTQSTQPLSTVTRGRMSTGVKELASEEWQALDPGCIEQWAFVDHPVVPGWRFTMRPSDAAFVFFTFHASGRGYYLTCLSPRFDDRIGHPDHVSEFSYLGEKIPIVCKSEAGSSHRTIAEVRGTAAKFALYHTIKAKGMTPPFSN